MEKLLYVDAALRGPESRTKRAADHLVNRLLASGRFQLETVTLAQEPLQNLTGAFFAERERLLEAGRLDHPRFAHAHRFAAADVIVVSAPFWDLTFPGQLKTYIENISVDGITFYADQAGCHGMSRGRQLIFVSTRGGFYENTPLEMSSPTLRALTCFFGIASYACLFAEGLDAEGQDPEALVRQLIAEIDEYVDAFLAGAT